MMKFMLIIATSSVWNDFFLLYYCLGNLHMVHVPYKYNFSYYVISQLTLNFAGAEKEKAQRFFFLAEKRNENFQLSSCGFDNTTTN